MIDVKVGDRVLYTLTAEDVTKAGGNKSTRLPGVVVAVFPSEDGKVNLKVFGDGPEDFWVTSIPHGEKAGQWLPG
jgi:hypothetical protein